MDDNPFSISGQQDVGDLQSPGPKFDQQLRVMQMIAVALMMGVVSFLFVVLLITKGEIFGQNGPTMLTIIAAVFAGMMVVGHMVIPAVVASAHVKAMNGQTPLEQTAESRSAFLISVYQVQLIIALALLEGAAFFNLIVLISGKHVLSALMVVTLLVLMLLKFPTRTKVMWWVQDRLREI